MDSTLINLYKRGSLVIPLYFLDRYKELSIDMESFIVLMYFHGKGNNLLFDPDSISSDLSLSSIELMEIVDKLSTMHLLDIKSVKDNNDILNEVIDLSPFYERMVLKDIPDDNDACDIYDKIQVEFGRTLSPSEIEVIKSWVVNGNSREVIDAAIREASINKVSNIRYIDKILYDWNSKGIKEIDELNKYRNPVDSKVEVDEIIDYDWLND